MLRLFCCGFRYWRRSIMLRQMESTLLVVEVKIVLQLAPTGLNRRAVHLPNQAKATMSDSSSERLWIFRMILHNIFALALESRLWCSVGVWRRLVSEGWRVVLNAPHKGQVVTLNHWSDTMPSNAARVASRYSPVRPNLERSASRKRFVAMSRTLVTSPA